MRYFIGGILGGVFFYVLLAAKERIMSGAESPDERICSMARICGVAFLAMLCWESFEYFFRDRQSAASLFALTGMLGGFQLGAEVHWHVSVGRHLGRKK
jgi:hypothetical protein